MPKNTLVGDGGARPVLAPILPIWSLGGSEMNLSRLFLFATVTLGAVVTYQNCSDTNFRRTPSTARPVTITEKKAIQIISVFPTTGTSETPVDVTVFGQNFSQSTEVRFGDQSCQAVMVISDNEILCSLAATPTVGFVDVSASASDRDPGTLPNGFEWTMTIAQKCASPAHRVSQALTVSFAAQNQQCGFGANGNLTVQQGAVRARYEQTVNLAIPDNTAVCDMQFQFTNQQFRYDDMFIFTFNDVILVSSDHASQTAGLTATSEGFLIYDWMAIRGRAWGANAGSNNPYCLGAGNGMGNCSIPATEQTATMILDIDDTLITKISERQQDVTKNKFMFITTGDDNPAIDCQHSGINFNVNVVYVKK